MKRSLIEVGNRSGWALALALTVLLLAGALLPPFLAHGPRELLMAGYKVLCHQLPERSFAVGGVPLALCHRCTGVVAGLVTGVLALPLLGPAAARIRDRARVLLLGAAVPLALDWAVEVLGIWANTPASRALTGAVFGVAAGLVLAAALAEPIRRERVKA